MTRKFMDDLAVLASPAFVIALSLLLVNDWVLKPWLHDWLTGKVSDFSGLFVFGTLMVLLSPRRPGFMLLSTAAIFLWWKSPLSQPAIDFCNAHLRLSVGRTVDYSDLMAFLVLPFVQTNRRHWQGRRVSRFVLFPLGTLAVFAVCATSSIPVIDGGEVHMPTSNDADTQTIAALYDTIDDFAVAHGLALDAKSVDQYHRRYFSRSHSLNVNYAPSSRTLYYGFGPTTNHFPFGNGISVGADVRALQQSFLQAVSSRFPGVSIVQDQHFPAWGGGQMGANQHSALQVVHFADVHTDESGCVRPDDSNPDMEHAFQIADDFARQNGFVPGKGFAQASACQSLLRRTYVSGGVVGPGLESYSVQFEVAPWSDPVRSLVFDIVAQADGMDRGAALASQLHDLLSSAHWKSDKVRVDDVLQPF